jgi:hypothetical protein
VKLALSYPVVVLGLLLAVSIWKNIAFASALAEQREEIVILRWMRQRSAEMFRDRQKYADLWERLYQQPGLLKEVDRELGPGTLPYDGGHPRR